MRGNTERPRCRWLVNQGCVVDSGRTRIAPSGKPVKVWIVTGNGPSYHLAAGHDGGPMPLFRCGRTGLASDRPRWDSCQ